jgi:hypothetical protein
LEIEEVNILKKGRVLNQCAIRGYTFIPLVQLGQGINFGATKKN